MASYRSSFHYAISAENAELPRDWNHPPIQFQSSGADDFAIFHAEQTVARLLTATWWKGSGKGTTNRTVSVALARQHSRLLLRGHPTGRVRACSGIANDARVSQTGTTSARFTGARPVTKASITTTESATLFLDKPSIADRGSGKDRMDCMRQFRAAWDRFSADQARLTEFLEMKRKSARGRICGHSFAQHRLAWRTIQWRVWLSEAHRTGWGLVVGCPCVGPFNRRDE